MYKTIRRFSVILVSLVISLDFLAKISYSKNGLFLRPPLKTWERKADKKSKMASKYAIALMNNELSPSWGTDEQMGHIILDRKVSFSPLVYIALLQLVNDTEFQLSEIDKGRFKSKYEKLNFIVDTAIWDYVSRKKNILKKGKLESLAFEPCSSDEETDRVYANKYDEMLEFIETVKSGEGKTYLEEMRSFLYAWLDIYKTIGYYLSIDYYFETGIIVDYNPFIDTTPRLYLQTGLFEDIRKKEMVKIDAIINGCFSAKEGKDGEAVEYFMEAILVDEAQKKKTLIEISQRLKQIYDRKGHEEVYKKVTATLNEVRTRL